MSYKAKGLRPWKQTPQSFWAKVKVGSRDECWPWQRMRIKAYGYVRWKGHMRYAHRVAAYLHKLVRSPKAPRNRYGGGFVMHTCDNGLCCNPRHFRIGTYQQNVRDCIAKGRFTRLQGTANRGGGKLTNRQVRAIRRQYMEGCGSQSQLGRKYNVSQVLIGLIVNRRIWTHI